MSGIYDLARVMLLTQPVDWRISNLMMTAWGGIPDFKPQELTVADMRLRMGVINELGESLPITGMAVTSTGIAQTNPVVIPGIAPGKIVTHFTISQYHPAANKSELYLFIDDSEGLPWPANGLDLVVQPDWAKSRGWFKP